MDGLNQQTFNLKSNTLSLSHCAPKDTSMYFYYNFKKCQIY